MQQRWSTLLPPSCSRPVAPGQVHPQGRCPTRAPRRTAGGRCTRPSTVDLLRLVRPPRAGAASARGAGSSLRASETGRSARRRARRARPGPGVGSVKQSRAASRAEAAPEVLARLADASERRQRPVCVRHRHRPGRLAALEAVAHAHSQGLSRTSKRTAPPLHPPHRTRTPPVLAPRSDSVASLRGQGSAGESAVRGPPDARHDLPQDEPCSSVAARGGEIVCASPLDNRAQLPASAGRGHGVSAARYSPGLRPVQRLNALKNALVSLKPTR
jgi:hypothetical protein